MRLRVEWLTPENADDLGPVGLALHNAWGAGLNPDDPTLELDEFLAFRSRTPSYCQPATAIGFVDGAGVALAEVNMMVGANSHLVDVRTLYVAEPHRRQGVASELLRTVAEYSSESNYTSMVVWANGDAMGSFCEHHGLAHQTSERHSRVALDNVDSAQQNLWAAGERAMAAGFQSVRLPPHCPDDLVDAACVSYNAEQDLPLGDLDYTHPLFDVDGLRAGEADFRAAGLASFRTMAVAPDGSGAGITELCVNTHRPRLGIQGTTAVVPQHRGHRIGRWLKALNLASARADYPQLRFIDTTNGEANPWMLAINNAMGFRAHHTSLLYGGSLGNLHA